jgi:hypothetical protein
MRQPDVEIRTTEPMRRRQICFRKDAGGFRDPAVLRSEPSKLANPSNVGKCMLEYKSLIDIKLYNTIPNSSIFFS